MPMKMTTAAVLTILFLPRIASAQNDRGASVGGNISALNMDSSTSASYSATFDYRFTPVVGFEIDTTFAPSLKSPYPGATIQSGATPTISGAANVPTVIGTIVPTPTFANQAGRAVIFSNNVRVSIPTTTSRIEPFFVAGGGAASVRHTADLRYTFPPIIVLGRQVQGPQTVTYPLTTSSVGLALTLGGGVGIKATSHLWIDADLRLFRVLEDTDQNIGRFGVGARWAF